MKRLTLSQLVNLADIDLVGAHDEIHESAHDPFLSWYHDQVVDEMTTRGLAHFERDTFDAPSPMADYEISTSSVGGHSHVAMTDAKGNGFTDIADGHGHAVVCWDVVDKRNHGHGIDIPVDAEIDDEGDVLAQASKAVIEKMSSSLGGFSVAGGYVQDYDGHRHKVVIFEPEMGFGQTSFDDGHNHWVYKWSVQESNDHTHGIDAESLSEMSGIFQAVGDEGEGGPSKNVKSVLSDKLIDVDFGKDSHVCYSSPDGLSDKQAKSLSATEAWELWGSSKNALLITPIISGIDLQAHVEYSEGEIRARLICEGKDVTSNLPGVASSIKCINVEEGNRVVLTGTLTTRSGREAAPELLRQWSNTMTSTFYVNDCWFDDGGMELETAEVRRKRTNNLLSLATGPSLKLMPYATAYDEEKALRVTTKSAGFDGAVGVRWREAEVDLTAPPEEICIYSQ